MRIQRNESGVAMVTVLLIAAVLTVTASTATFLTIQEFRQGADDRRASGALAYAEAGIDRVTQAIRGGSWARTVLSGCQNVPSSQGPRSFPVRTWQGRVGGGTFSVELRRADDCVGVTRIPRVGETQEMRIISTGQQPTAKRVVEQIVEVTRAPLPIGLHGGTVSVNGTPGVRTVSVVSLTDIVGREKLIFQGLDKYFEKSDFYFCYGPNDPVGCIADDAANDGPIPAAAHAAGQITSTNGAVEHPFDGSCAGLQFWNGAKNADPLDVKTQALWDGSSTGTALAADPGCGHSAGFPPTHEFTGQDARRIAPTPQLPEEAHEFFRDLARQEGLYCGGDAADECTINGQPQSVGSLIQQGEFNQLNRKVIYLEFGAGDPLSQQNRFQWSLQYPTSCTAEPAIVIVRNGGLKVQGQGTATSANASSFFGAIFAEDGIFESEGGYVIDGTVIALDLQIGGGGIYQLSDCWLENAPGSHIAVRPTAWHEIDRPSQ